MVETKFLKNFASNSMTQVKRIIVSPNAKKLNFQIEIDDIEQGGLEIDNRPNCTQFYEIADSEEWGASEDKLAVELQIMLIPITDDAKRITKEPYKEYAAKFTVNCFSTNNPENEKDKQLVKELFKDLAVNSDICVHSTDYWCLEE